MNIYEQDLMILSAPADIQIVVVAVFAFAAIALFCLAVEDGVYPSVSHWLAMAGRHIRKLKSKLRECVESDYADALPA